jgi:hypothetical protein
LSASTASHSAGGFPVCATFVDDFINLILFVSSEFDTSCNSRYLRSAMNTRTPEWIFSAADSHRRETCALDHDVYIQCHSQSELSVCLNPAEGSDRVHSTTSVTVTQDCESDLEKGIENRISRDKEVF